MSRNFELLRRAIPADQILGLEASSLVTETVNGNSRPKLRRTSSVSAESPEIHRFVQDVFLLKGKSAKALIFASVESGDEPSWICERAAQALAEQVEGKVCVLDANFVTPSAHQYFAVGNDRGMAEALLSGERLSSCARATGLVNLSVITTGSATREVPAWLNPAVLATELLDLRRHFEYLLIDAPAVQSQPTALLLSKLADGIILIVEADKTRRETAAKAKEELERAQANVLGAILNNRKFPIPEAIYSRL